jgi:hypothetical protein
MIARVAAARKLLTLIYYGANAKLAFEAVLDRDGRPGAIYGCQQHREVAPRRLAMRLGRLADTARL